jgi:pyridoxine/pyridoxamine 5'-phosphate oxidase
MTEWFETLPGTLTAAWNRLVKGVQDPAAPTHALTLATVGRRGGAEARQVILRRADPEGGLVEFHTDTSSDKVAELTRVPWATVLAWDPAAGFQIRMRAHVTILSGDASRGMWKQVHDGARRFYGANPPPGSPIPAADAYESRSDPAHFAVLRCILQEIETLHLGGSSHAAQKRAIFRRGDGWQGGWLVP